MNLFESLVARARGSDAIAQPLVRPVDALALVAPTTPPDLSPSTEPTPHADMPRPVAAAPPLVPAPVPVIRPSPAAAPIAGSDPRPSVAVPPASPSVAAGQGAPATRDAPRAVEHRHTIERRLETTREQVVHREITQVVEHRAEPVLPPPRDTETRVPDEPTATEPAIAARARADAPSVVSRPVNAPAVPIAPAPPRTVAARAIEPRIENASPRPASRERVPDPVVHVHIDRIVVRAAPLAAPAPRPAPPAAPTGTELLARYLAERSSKP